jgi:hypothetical protein
VAGATGTDWSQQDAAQGSGVNLTVDATTNTDVTPDGYSVSSADVGNLIQITTTGGGAAFTTGFYEIKSIQGGTKWRLDRSPAAVGAAGATWAIGGALATINKVAGAMVTSNKAFIKGTSFTTTASIAVSVGTTPRGSSPPTALIGYTTTRGDGGRARLTLSTNTGLTGLSSGGGTGVRFENIEVDCANLGTSIGMVVGQFGQAVNCKVQRFTSKGIVVSGDRCQVQDCEVTAGGSAASSAIELGNVGNQAMRCYVHDNACPGVVITGNHCQLTRSLIANNSGASSDGVRLDTFAISVTHNTIYANGRHGINHNDDIGINLNWRNNILAQNGGYGIVGSNGSALPAAPEYDGNAYYANTSGARSGMDNTSGVMGVVPYTNTLDVIPTADPFVDKANNDYRLNTTPGGGAACRGHGTPASWPGNSLTTGYPDLGAAQHADPGGLLTGSGMTGGMRG